MSEEKKTMAKEVTLEAAGTLKSRFEGNEA